jgi:hypothetical protein
MTVLVASNWLAATSFSRRGHREHDCQNSQQTENTLHTNTPSGKQRATDCGNTDLRRPANFQFTSTPLKFIEKLVVTLENILQVSRLGEVQGIHRVSGSQTSLAVFIGLAVQENHAMT